MVAEHELFLRAQTTRSRLAGAGSRRKLSGIRDGN